MASIVRAKALQILNILQPMAAVHKSVKSLHRMPAVTFANARQISSAPSYEYLLVDKRGENGCVGLVTLNRPKALNALCEPMMVELGAALQTLDNDPAVAAIVITGSEKAFVAGADIKHMVTQTFADFLKPNFLVQWKGITSLRKPVIAAVNGFALGGGCEMAIMCDMILAGEKAKFGQPEIILGTIPGGGGTQRLTRAIGKSRAMQMCLTGEPITAQQANEWGLVSSIHSPDKLVDDAIKLGEKIASHSKAVVVICKEAVNSALELSQSEGLRFENRLFAATFSLNDRKEGMTAFIEKRKPNFTDS